MLTYPKLIHQLSTSDKVRLLCNMQHLSEKQFRIFGIPEIRIASFEKEGSQDAPSLIALSNTWDAAFLEAFVEGRMQELAMRGTDLVILPGPRPKFPPYLPTVSEDPYLSSVLTAACVRAAKRCGLSVALDGFSVTGEDIEWMDREPDREALQKFWIAPFRDAVQDTTCAVFCTAPDPSVKNWEQVNTELAAALSKQLPNHATFFLCQNGGAQTVSLLRRGYLCRNGSEVSLNAALSHYQRLQAGMEKGTTTLEELNAALSEGTALSPEMLDEAVDRLLQLAFAVKRPSAVLGGLSAIPTAENALHRSIVLLKNSGVLPLTKQKRLCLMGDIGFEESDSLIDKMSVLLSAQGMTVVGPLRGYDLSRDRSDEQIQPACKAAAAADAIVLLLGLGRQRESTIRRMRKNSIPANQQALLHALSGLKKPIIVVMPPELCPDLVFEEMCEAILLAPLHLPASPQTLCDVLLGKESPSGKLASTVYCGTDSAYAAHLSAKRREGLKTGSFVGYRYYTTAGLRPSFPFGHGLSYTKLTYSQLSVSNGQARFTVTNSGHFSAVETAQVYLQKESPVAVRPRKELVGFACIQLAPGQSQTVTVPFAQPQFRDEKSGGYVAEAGEYTLCVGSSVTDIRLTAQLKLTGQLPPDGSKFSDYLQTESNILSDQFKLEATTMTKKKPLFHLLTGIGLLLLAVLLKVYCASLDIGNTFFTLFSLILAVAGVSELAMEAVEHHRRSLQQKADTNAEATAAFEAANATTIPVESAERMFADSFDEDGSDDSESIVPEIEGVELDQLAYVDKAQTFAGAARDFAVFAEERGCRLSAETCVDLFASIASSRLLVVRDMSSNDFQKFFSLVCSYFSTDLAVERVDASFDTPERLLFQTEDIGIRSRTGIFSLLQTARSNPQLLHFAALDQVVPQQLPGYFTPFLRYIHNPKGDFTLRIPNEQGSPATCRVPENVWFVLNLAAGKSPAEIPTFISDVACVNRFAFDTCPAAMKQTELRPFSYFQLTYLTTKAANTHTVPEELWKKVDLLEKSISSPEPILDNKLWLCLERYAHVSLACEQSAVQALDHAVCAKLLVTIMSVFRTQSAPKPLDELVEDALGEEGSVVCRRFIRECRTTGV